MSAMLIHNIGQLVSGDFASPLLDGDSLLVRDGVIAEIGDGLATGAGATTINANGATVMPGFIDSHVHPVIGDYTPAAKGRRLHRQLRSWRRHPHDFRRRGAHAWSAYRRDWH